MGEVNYVIDVPKLELLSSSTSMGCAGIWSAVVSRESAEGVVGVGTLLSAVSAEPNVIRSWPSIPACLGRAIFRLFGGTRSTLLLSCRFCLFFPPLEDDDIDDAGVDSRFGMFDADPGGIKGLAEPGVR